MKELWSKTQPSEPGWYYCCDTNDEPHSEFIGRYRGDDQWEFPGVSGTLCLNQLLRIGIKFGPKVMGVLDLINTAIILYKVLALVDEVSSGGSQNV